MSMSVGTKYPADSCAYSHGYPAAYPFVTGLPYAPDPVPFSARKGFFTGTLDAPDPVLASIYPAGQAPADRAESGLGVI